MSLLRNNQDQNIFALPRSDVATGREGAAFEDTKYISETAEHFSPVFLTVLLTVSLL